jgi:hypothetical protein
MNRVGRSLQHLLLYADEGEDMLNRLLLGMNQGCITTELDQSVLQCNGNLPAHLQPRSLSLCHQLGRLCLPWFEILREYC